MLAVLHQPALARRHADRVVGLRDGRVVLDGPPDLDVSTLYPSSEAAPDRTPSTHPSPELEAVP